MVKELTFISSRDMRKNRADAVQVMFMCHGFTKANINVTLVTPYVERSEFYVSRQNIFALYGMEEAFKIEELNTRLREKGRGNSKSGYLQTISQKLLKHLVYAWKNREKYQTDQHVIYSKCFISIVPYIIFKKLRVIKSPILFEAVMAKNKLTHKWVLKNSTGIVVAAPMIKDNLEKSLNIQSNKILLLKPRYIWQENGQLNSKNQYRQHFKLEDDKAYILYAGKTGKNLKQTEYFAEAAKKMPDLNFVIVGANDQALADYQKRDIPNLILVPFQTFPEYKKYLQVADLLVAYYPDNLYNRYFLGPAKAGPYFSSGNPVLFSDLPSLRDRFSECMVYFAPPDDVDSLVNKIRYIINHPEEASEKTIRAKEYVKNHTFDEAAKDLAEQINNYSFVN